MDRVKRVEKDSMVSWEHATKPEADSTSSGSGTDVDCDVTVQCEELFAACNRLDAEGVKAALEGMVVILGKAGELSGVATILEECGGLHRIELLQRHSHKVVRRKAAEIVELLSPDDV